MIVSLAILWEWTGDVPKLLEQGKGREGEGEGEAKTVRLTHGAFQNAKELGSRSGPAELFDALKTPVGHPKALNLAPRTGYSWGTRGAPGGYEVQYAYPRSFELSACISVELFYSSPTA